MELERTAVWLEALGNPMRLAIFRLLVQAGDDGASVGAVRRNLDIPPSTLSHHLSRLIRVGLVTQERRSRTLICRADFAVMDAILLFLNENCCAGLDKDPNQGIDGHAP